MARIGDGQYLHVAEILDTQTQRNLLNIIRDEVGLSREEQKLPVANVEILQTCVYSYRGCEFVLENDGCAVAFIGFLIGL